MKKKLLIFVLAVVCIIVIMLLIQIIIKKLAPSINDVKSNFIPTPTKYINNCQTKAIRENDIIGTWTLAATEIPEGVTIESVKIKFEKDGIFILTGWKEKNFISKGNWKFDERNNNITINFLDNLSYWKVFVKNSPRENDASIENNSAKFNLNVSQFSYPNGRCQYQFWLWGWKFEKIK